MNTCCRRAGVVTFCFLLLASVAIAQKRSITEKDLFKFQWIGDPQISPDGSQVAFVRVTVDEKQAGYETSIWIAATGGGSVRTLTSGKHDSSPRWSSDGKLLAFMRAVEKDGRDAAAADFHPSGNWRRGVAVDQDAAGRGRSRMVAGR